MSNKDTFLKEYERLIKELTLQIKAEEPENVVQFCLDFFQSFPPKETISLPYKVTRRISVSAESIQPKRPRGVQKIPKSEHEKQMIEKSLQSHFLFKNIEEGQRQQAIEMMKSRSFSEGECVIEQGTEGDFFYIVSLGTLDCFVDKVCVEQYERGGSFGELALMYNAPRAASLIGTSYGELWALDRLSFRWMMMESNQTKRSLHTSFLQQVPLLQDLSLSEIHRIADALETRHYDRGDKVITAGEVGDCFYIIEEGSASCHSKSKKVNQLFEGHYFGELALIHDKPRAVTVIAEGPLKCVALTKLAFIRLLGPLMKSNTQPNYSSLEDTRV
ncbi:cyclic nucleotide-binding-like protein [Sporodiniella umbellata]|nr:cyclic nucleotide-binding-like protein [Sporodiniella umbellata]